MDNRNIFVDMTDLKLLSFTDIHCHCLPGVDDGPAAVSEAIALCQGLVEDGINTAIATPHQLGRFSETNEAVQIRQAVADFNNILQNNGINLAVFPGGDVRVDERICELLASDKILTLADGGKYILLELPHQIFLDIEPLLAELSSMGIQAIISHPERHPFLARAPQMIPNLQTRADSLGVPPKWFDYPIHLQITAGSLLGQFGQQAKTAAWYFLKTCLASLVATDCHDLGSRRPCMKAAFQVISAQLGREVAKRVCVDNPAKILHGQNIESSRAIGTRMSSDGVLPTNF